MMQRILELPAETRRRYDTSSLSVVAASGSALPGDLATEWMDEFGDTLYNLYGSTEVAWATIATPADMRAAPGTAGTPPRGTVAAALRRARACRCRRARPAASSSATRCSSRATPAAAPRTAIDGLMATGDVGRFDDARAPVRRGPRRRDDRLGRREPVPEGGRGPARPPRGGRRGRGDRRARRRGSASGCAPSWSPQPGAEVSEDDLKAYVKENLAALQGPARDLVPGRAAAQRHRQGPQARAARDGERAGCLRPGLTVALGARCPSARRPRPARRQRPAIGPLLALVVRDAALQRHRAGVVADRADLVDLVGAQHDLGAAWPPARRADPRSAGRRRRPPGSGSGRSRRPRRGRGSTGRRAAAASGRGGRRSDACARSARSPALDPARRGGSARWSRSANSCPADEVAVEQPAVVDHARDHPDAAARRRPAAPARRATARAG